MCNAQKNIDKIQSNLAELGTRLKHEQEKFKTYHVDMQEAETRYIPHLYHGSLDVKAQFSSPFIATNGQQLLHGVEIQSAVQAEATFLVQYCYCVRIPDYD